MKTTIPESEKLTFSQVEDIIIKYHKDNNITYTNRNDKPILTFRIVYDPIASKWNKFENLLDPNGKYAVDKYGNFLYDETKPIKYTIDKCTYEFSDDNKFFFGECLGNSLFAFCVDSHDVDHMGIRLDHYLGRWKCLYCYQVK